MTQRFLEAAKYVMNQINSANLSGAIDVIVVEQEDGSLVCSPFHVRFGKLGTLVAAGRPVDVLINGEPVPSLRMKLGQAGEAFFVEERTLEEGETVPQEDSSAILTTPIASDIEEEACEAQMKGRIRRTLSLSEEVSEGEVGVPTPESKRRRWLRPLEDECDKVRSEGEEDPEPMPHLISCKSDSLLSSVTEETCQTQDSMTWEWGELPVEQPVQVTAVNQSFVRRASFDGCVTFTLKETNSESEYESDTETVTEESGIENTGKAKRLRKKKQGGTKEKSKKKLIPDSELKNEEELEETTKDGPVGAEISDNDKLENKDELCNTVGKENVNVKEDEGKLENEEDEKKKEEIEAKEKENKDEETNENEVGKAKEKEEKVTEEEKGKDSENVTQKEKEERKPKAKGEEEEKGKGKGEKEEDKAKLKKASGGIYLSEVIDRPELHELYVYGRSSDGFATPGSREGAASPVDLGYRSDGEGSASISPVPQNSGLPTASIEDDAYRIRNLQLSLCGGFGGDEPTASAAVNAAAAESAELEGVDSERFRAHMVLYEEFCHDPDGILKNPKLVVLFNGRYYNWTVAAPLLVTSLVYQCELPPKTVDRMIQQHMAKKEVKRRSSMFSRWTSWGRRPQPDPARRKELTEQAPAPAAPSGPSFEAPTAPKEEVEPRVFHVKSLRLPSERLRELGLRPGANTIEYRVVSQFQGTARCHAQVFLWHWSDRLVISDIDGTITQSDVMGQLGPFLGRDVSQRGVAGLYSRIAANRFRVIYLSSRAIGQAHWTRSYLESVVQDKGTRLPPGPLLLSPTSLLFALVREIRNRPEDFKIPCLRDVRSLFPVRCQPFFAGFGNKINDVRAYEAVGIPAGRIFVVNPEGDLRRHGLHHYRTNYSSLGELVDHFFPEPADLHLGEFSEFAFWRQEPPPLLDQDEK